jgi:glycosyltransferase involved in cell wall biosynthesis
MNRRYIVVTPCRNEEKNLPNLIESMAEQTIRPVLWVIVDDGSTDNTPKIIKVAKEKQKWIENIRLNRKKRDLGLHYARVWKIGFDFAINYTIKNGIACPYLGSVDGDIILGSTFFENLIKEFEKNPNLGIASGGIKRIIGSRVMYSKGRIDEPSGGNMLIRRKCFDECGIPISYSPDSVLNVKARLKGWETKRFEENIVTEVRDVFSASGYWNGYFQFGKSIYYRNLNPIHVMIKSVMFSFKKPYYIGIAYLLGYLSDFIQRKEQINDEEIKKYYWNKWKKYL